MRWIAGVLLVCAALLKSVELFSAPTVAMANPLGRILLPVQIGVEFGLGLFVLSGLYWSNVRWLLLLLFVGFAGYSMYLAMSGAASCGCFGPLRVHPWWMLFVDLVVAVGLVFPLANRRGQQDVVGQEICGARARRFHVVRCCTLVSTTSISVVAVAILVRFVDWQAAVVDGVTVTRGGLVVLQPDLWIGRKLPIAASVDLDLTNGAWVAVLLRDNCSACQESLARYEQLAMSGRKVALIEVPPYGDHGSNNSACRYGRLKEDREWLVQTPVELHLLNGVVTAAKTHAN